MKSGAEGKKPLGVWSRSNSRRKLKPNDSSEKCGHGIECAPRKIYRHRFKSCAFCSQAARCPSRPSFKSISVFKQRLRRRTMVGIVQVAFIMLMLMSPTIALARPAEDANAAVDRWSVAFNTNDPESIAKNYCPDAILLAHLMHASALSEGRFGRDEFVCSARVGSAEGLDRGRCRRVRGEWIGARGASPPRWLMVQTVAA